MLKKETYIPLLILIVLFGCSVVKIPYKITKTAVKTTYVVGKIAFKTTCVVYKVGEFTFKVIKAPLSWALTHEEIESIDGLPPKEAIKKGRVKTHLMWYLAKGIILFHALVLKTIEKRALPLGMDTKP